MNLQSLDPRALSENPFTLLGDDWGLLSAARGDAMNTMTVSWGGLGVLWGLPVCTVYVRPQRYTKEFIDAASHFTLSFFDESHRKALQYCGAHSGRDGDKAKAAGLTPVRGEHGAVWFAEARLVLVCRKLYAQPFEPACFVDASVDQRHYPNRDHHTQYMGEVVDCLQRP